MLHGVRTRSNVFALAAAVALAVAPSSATPQPVDDPEASFEDRFAMHGIAPVFTRPDVVALVAVLDAPAPDEMTASTGRPAGEGERPESLAFAEPKGPAKILKDLITTPITELIVPRAEAVPEAPPPDMQANAPAEAVPVPVRAADPLLERPPADRVAAVPAPSPSEAAEPRHDTQVGDPQQAPGSAPSHTAAAPLPEPDRRSANADRPARSMNAAAGRRIGAGRAAWYQHPGRTASGETFDANRLTAAHHTLPFGTRLRVVNEATGRSVVVRVNDRIPRQATIIIDLSRAGAQAIGLSGVGRVSLYRLDPLATAGVAPADAGALRNRTVKAAARQPAAALSKTRAVPPSWVAMQPLR